MTNEQILQKAINRAMANGLPLMAGWGHPMFKTDGTMVSADYNIIFSHKFAQAFWGNERKTKGKWFIGEAWQMHLQQMVLEEQPLNYLNKFMTKEQEIDSYKLSMDDHCLVIATKDKAPKWLNEKVCKWIVDNYENIDFEKDAFKFDEKESACDDPVTEILII
jgi:hypothetical protein